MDNLFKVQTPYDLPKLKRLPLREHPAYRVAQDPDACTLTELLAALVGGQQQIEVAEALMTHFGSLQRLRHSHIEELSRISGVGPQTAVRLKAALALSKKAIQESQDERPAIHCPADAAALIQFEMSNFEQEHLWVLLLDSRNRVIEIIEVYHGSVNAAQVRVAELFKPAIQRMAAAIIVSHNHPSGDSSASPDDIAVTRAIVQAGRLLDIPCLDHIIIGKGHYVSLKERALGFESGVSESRPIYQAGEDEVIYAYSRAQALADGVLVDVTQRAKEAGFKLPTAITADLQAALTPNQREQSFGQSFEGRLWDVLFLATFATRRAIWNSPVAFRVRLAVCQDHHHRLLKKMLDLWLVIGPGDAIDGQSLSPEPVITIGFPEDF